MSLRFSIDDALEKGWISPDQAARQKALAKHGAPKIEHDGRRGRVKKEAETSGRPAAPDRILCSVDGDMPQEKLWRACVRHWPQWLKSGELVWEFGGAVPNRRFRLDIAFPRHRLACEVDGWEHHGKYLADFKRDRHRDRCLALQGWRVLRFYAEEIHADSQVLVCEIEKAIAVGVAELAQ